MATLASRYDEDEIISVRSLLALDVEPPASFAFYLGMQFPAIAGLLLEARKNADGMRLCVSADDWRLNVARKLGLVPVGGRLKKSQDEERRKGFFLTSYARAVRNELMILENANGRFDG